MTKAQTRILLVDDSPAIHGDFTKVLSPELSDDRRLEYERAALFGDFVPEEAVLERPSFELVSAFSGSEAIDCLNSAVSARRPFSVAFVDMNMPGGRDGVDTIEALWSLDPELQVVLCTAYRERTWEDVQRRLGATDRLLLLKKPFDGIEVLQLASALSRKATLGRRARRERDQLAALVAERTQELSAANRALVDQMVDCRRAEDEARAAAEELRKAHDELAEAHSQVQAATQAKSEFLANLSHEIRTPMTAILGYADLLSDPQLTYDERAEHLRVITRSGRHLLNILGDILDLSTLEAGRMRIQPIPCSPGSLLADLASALRVRALEKDLTLEVGFRGPVPASIRTDPTRLRQLLTHLIDNAIKFTDAGGVTVLARLAEEDTGGPQLEIEVCDTGIGVASEQLETLFVPFQQVDGSNSRRHGGAGLGLAIAQRLAHQLGGDIHVESELGQGSSFRVRIATGSLEGVSMIHDLHEAVQVASGPASVDALPGAEGDGLALEGRRILIAEDGRDNQLLLSFYLRKAGARVEIADDGGKALRRAVEALAKDEPYHVIVSDMQMPVIDGYELVRRLRRDGYRAPIVALTAQALPGDRERCLAVGCNEYLSKPVDRARLVGVCAELAERGSGLGHTTIRPSLKLAPRTEPGPEDASAEAEPEAAHAAPAPAPALPNRPPLAAAEEDEDFPQPFAYDNLPGARREDDGPGRYEH